ncbi:EAL domain-containing protein [Metabacillus bambusae]|uniref:EAL domain-containing protein n=1 Tax=Metabacillus bambusae TaxID=2795218 RepID=A0ABS3NA04_9BACI|nr:EAL domain-containing protein [Metabacillus bambusae]MBO1515067.1 EAL domain-containing protein [Metabacillus bambusae]
MSIEELIKNNDYFHNYQPIYNISNWKIAGYEGLLRTKKFPNPEFAFLTAKKEKQLYELDSRSIHKAVITYNAAGFTKTDGYLFLNVFPSTILHANFPLFYKKIITDDNLSCQQIVFEISDLESITDLTTLKQKIIELKIQGFLIAIDDIGKGNSDLRAIIELEPEYIKLDRYFSDNLLESKQKQDFIQMFINYSENYNTKLILEGLENEKDLAVAKSLGITYAQGYILGKPKKLTKF